MKGHLWRWLRTEQTARVRVAYLTPQQAAERASVRSRPALSSGDIVDLIRAGHLPAVRIAHEWLIDPADLDDVCTRLGIGPARGDDLESFMAAVPPPVLADDEPTEPTEPTDETLGGAR